MNKFLTERNDHFNPTTDRTGPLDPKMSSTEYSASTDSAAENVVPTSLVNEDSLNIQGCFYARFRVHSCARQAQLYEIFAPNYPLIYSGITRINGKVVVLEIDEAKFNFGIELHHKVSLPEISELLPGLKDFQGNPIYEKAIGIVSLLCIVFRNLDDLITVGFCLISICALMGVATTIVGWLQSLLMSAIACFKKSIQPVIDNHSVKFNKRTETATYQSGKNDNDSKDEDENVIFMLKCFKSFDFVSGFALIGGFIFLICTTFILKAIPKKSDFDSAMYRIKNLPQTVKSSAEIIGFGTKYSKNIVSAVRKHCFGFDDEEFDSMKGVKEWMEEVQSMMNVQTSSLIKSDMNVQAKADALYQRGLNIAKTFDSLRLPHDQQFAFRNFLMAAQRLHDEANRSGAGFMMPRQEPLIACFFGASGLGKSVLTNVIIADLAKRRGMKSIQDVANSTYYRNPDQKHWDGFSSNHKFVVFDDFAARKDSEANPNPEVSEIISAGNTAPFNLPMASISEKATTFFRAEVMILTSNQSLPHIVSLSYPEAVYRRIDMRLRVRIKNEYAKECVQNGIRTSKLNTALLTLDKDRSESIVEPYLFDIVDADDRSNPPLVYAHENLNYEQMMNILSKADNDKRHHSRNLLSTMEAYMQREVAQYQMNGGDLSSVLNRRSDYGRSAARASQKFLQLEKHQCDLDEEAKTWVSWCKRFIGCKNEAYEHVHLHDWLDLPQMGIPERVDHFIADGTREELSYIFLHDCFYVPKSDFKRVVCALVAASRAARSAPVNASEHFVNAYVDHICDPHNGVNSPLVLPMICERNCQSNVSSKLRRMLNSMSEGFDYATTGAKIYFDNNFGKCKAATVDFALQVYNILRAVVIGFIAFIAFGTGIGILVCIIKKIVHWWRGESMEPFKIDKDFFKKTKLTRRQQRRLMLAPSPTDKFKNLFKKKQEPEIIDENTNWTSSFETLYCEYEMSDSEKLKKTCAFAYENGALPVDVEISGDDKTKAAPKVVYYEGTKIDKQRKKNKKYVDFVYRDGVKFVRAEDFRSPCWADNIKPEMSGEEKTKAAPKYIYQEGAREYGTMQAMLDENANTLISSLFLHNMMKVEIPYKMDENGNITWQHVLTITFIRGRLAIANRHLLMAFRQYDFVRLRGLSCPDGIVVSVKDIEVFHDESHDVYAFRDTMLLSFPRSIRQHRDIVHHFMTVEDYSNFRSMNKAALVGFLPHKEIMCGVFVTDKAQGVDGEVALGCETNMPQLIRRFFRYNVETAGGTCGSLLISLCKANQRKICAIHAGGRTDPDFQGYGTPVSQAMINHLVNIMIEKGTRRSVDTLVAEPLLPVVEYNMMQYDVPTNLGLKSEIGEWSYLLKPDRVEKGNFGVFGHLVRPVVQNTKSEIFPSPLYGKLEGCPSKQAPARLRPFKVFKDGEEMLIDPMARALEKANVCPIPLDNNILKDARDDVYHMLCTPTIYKRVLTDKEAIEGIEGDEYINAICRTSSAGYPWVLDKKSGTRGKETWLGKGENWNVTEDLVAAIKKRESEALLARRSPTIWIDVLKDERRTIEKVKLGKTRLFSCGPMDYNILVRKYFLGFCAHMMHGRIGNESAVGINPYSDEWHQLALRLSTHAGGVLAGDFSNFDGTLSPEILWAVFDVIDKWYSGTEEDSIVRNVLFADIVNSCHAHNNEVLGWWQSNPSGNPMTVIINSLYNMIAFRYLWFLLAGSNDPEMASMRKFNDNVKLITYGDDVVLNLTHRASCFFGMFDLEEAFSLIGMTFTDELKQDDINYDMRKLEDISFLKRKFRFSDEKCKFVAPLSLDTLVEIPQWVRGRLEHMEVTRTNCELVAYELSLHPRDVFDTYIAILRNAASHLWDRVIFETYDRYGWLDVMKFRRPIMLDEDNQE